MKDLAAAFVFFTRLSLWRLRAFNVPAEHYRQVVNYWAVVGWLTAGVMAATLWLSAQILPYSIAILLAMLSRLLLTGALHEDGLADFMDGFGGGGNNREKILAIMKDSHIGTYGVIGLLFYFLLFYNLLSHLSLEAACSLILWVDPICKFISSQITLFLPYSRTSETSKSRMVYKQMSIRPFLISCIFGLLPLALLADPKQWIALAFPAIAFLLLIFLMKKKIGGYTGDCCGALFLICELALYAGVIVLN